MTLIKAGIRRRPEPQLGQFITVKPPKHKVCKVCKAEYTGGMPLSTVCGLECAKSLAVSVRGKLEKVAAVKAKKAAAADRKDTRAKLDKLKSRAQWAKEAQAEFNKFIRLRDDDLPCISCGRHHQGQYHAGHFLSVGARPELRFSELNVNKQCAPCNTHLSGNAVLYRAALIGRIGLGGVEWLEGPHPTQHYTVDQLQTVKSDYAAKARALKAQA